MTGIEVTDVKAYFSANVANAGTKQKKSVSDESFADAIGGALNRNDLNGKDTNTGNKDALKSTSVSTKSGAGSEIREKVKTPVNDDKVRNEAPKKKVKNGDSEKIGDRISEEIAKVTEAIEDELSVDVEDIENAMAELGFVPTDLLNVNNVKELMINLSGQEDAIALLTNESLLEGIKNVSALIDDSINSLTGEFGLSEQELMNFVTDNLNLDEGMVKLSGFLERTSPQEYADEAVENNADANQLVMAGDLTDEIVKTVPDGSEADALGSNAEIPTTSGDVSGTLKASNPSQDADSETLTDDVSKSIESNAGIVSGESFRNGRIEASDSDTKETIAAGKDSLTGSADTIENTAGDKTTVQSGYRKDEENGNDSSADSGNQPRENIFGTINELNIASNKNVANVPESYSMPYADAERIMEQIAERVKVNVTEDVSSMEVQLHPASLGTVNISVESSGGTVTAKLTVQNESVKAALQTQMVQLLETFAEQGQKIDAIEVAVAGYDLDRSLNQNSDSNNQSRNGKENSEIKVASRRRLNLNSLDESELTELSEEEQLAVEMMEMNGTSVDYMA